MPQSTKDNNGGKNHPVKNTGASGAAKGKEPKNPNSPTGSQNKGEKKTTP